MHIVQVDNKKKILIVFINLLVGGLHFLTGRNYREPFPGFVDGYLIDILLPFALYFLLCLVNLQIFNTWWGRTLLPFLFGTGVEILQYYGVPLFGQTYDPLDFLAYGAGVILAAVADRLIFRKYLPFWETVSS